MPKGEGGLALEVRCSDTINRPRDKAVDNKVSSNYGSDFNKLPDFTIVRPFICFIVHKTRFFIQEDDSRNKLK